MMININSKTENALFRYKKCSKSFNENIIITRISDATFHNGGCRGVGGLQLSYSVHPAQSVKILVLCSTERF